MSVYPRAAGPARHSWVTPVLPVLLIAVPIFEVWLLIQVGQLIGGLWLLLILVGEAALGAWLLRHEGARSWRALNGAMSTGQLPAGELADTGLILVGGVLLMLPGFTTDVIGLLFLLPMTRPAARRILGFFIARRVQRMGLPTVTPVRGDVIEGETVDDPMPPRPAPNDPLTITGEVEDRR